MITIRKIDTNCFKFYHKQGAVLSKVDMYAYYDVPDCRSEVQFLWYLDL